MYTFITVQLYLLCFGNGAKYCDQRVCLFVCVSVCKLALSQNLHVQISPNFLFILPVTVARSFFDCNAIRYVLRFCG